MPEFIAKSSMPDPAAIRRRNFASRIFPELPSEEEISRISELIGASEVEFWAFEFGHAPRHFGPQAVGLMLDLLFEHSPYSLLIGFLCKDLLIWAPDDHEYLIVFGQPDLVQQVEQSGIFSYSFADYLASGDLSERAKAHLINLAQSYNIG